MNSKIQTHHQERYAYIYLRQSTMGQVRYNRESTERQYALKDRALSLGWAPHLIKVLDGDLGISGTQSHTREDFKTLIADVSLKKVGGVFAVEASRLARSNTDWHRLLELCSLTSTLILDEDGCYDPCDFNDQLILGVKGTLSQAELHFIRARLLGGKKNKARKGELQFPLPAGLIFDSEGKIILDPDQEVRNVIFLFFKVFREGGSAFSVVKYFAHHKLQFPKRIYKGVWSGKLVWGPLRHSRVLSILKNPSYAGTYAFGRHKLCKQLSSEGKLAQEIKRVPMSSWEVLIPHHHEEYISWQDYLENQKTLENNRNDIKGTPLLGSAREGSALLQGLLTCSKCGRRLMVRYNTRQRGLYPTYDCSWRRAEFAGKRCMQVKGTSVDEAVSQRVLEIVKPAQLEIALKAWEELESRERALDKQWTMKIERTEYEAQLAQRSYEEVDPSNRLVAATLEKRWNNALENIASLHKEYEIHQQKSVFKLASSQKQQLLSLAKDLPRLWTAPTTLSKDRKRILRLLIKDIIVERKEKERKIVLHICWQGGEREDLEVMILPPVYEQVRIPQEIVERVRNLAKENTDAQIVERLEAEGIRDRKNNLYTKNSVQRIRHKHSIAPFYEADRRRDELSVKEIMKKFDVREHVVYGWVNRNLVRKRQIKKGSPLWITLDPETERELKKSIQHLKQIQQHSVRGVV